ncbi:MAG: hypothetical protein JXR37_23175 [Kiritimatiellae bacterium]|nr:hypothetical protein [Kiritimatiellia bacterium]
MADQLAERDSDCVQEIQSLVEELAECYFAQRYPGFDLEDPDWDELRGRLATVQALLRKVKGRIDPPSAES